MVCKLAYSFVCWQLEKGFISSDNKDVFLYGYELFFNLIFNFIIAILVAIIFSSWVEVFVFYLSYALLRSFAGGYHARNYEKCMVVSGTILILTCVLIKIVDFYWYPIVGAINIFLSVPAIWKQVPVEDHNKPLDSMEIRVFKKKARLILSFEAALAILFLILHCSKLGFVISLSLLIQGITVTMGRIKNRRLISADSIKDC